MSDEEMTDNDYLETVRKAREESVRFFSSANRAERELWVANEFLTNLGIPFAQSDLVHVADDPPDVRFGGAEFEVKEILDSGRRRHAEFKASLEKAKAAKSPSELLEHYTPRDITYAEIYELVEEKVLELSTKYSEKFRKELDLLFYVNLEDVHGYIENPLPPSEKLKALGFRSVSLVMGLLSGVLMVNECAPKFLSEKGPRVVRRKRTEG